MDEKAIKIMNEVCRNLFETGVLDTAINVAIDTPLIGGGSQFDLI